MKLRINECRERNGSPASVYGRQIWNNLPRKRGRLPERHAGLMGQDDMRRGEQTRVASISDGTRHQIRNNAFEGVEVL